MEHNFIVINSSDTFGQEGLVVHPPSTLISDLRNTIAQINSWDLKPTRLIMSKQDYDDIVGWSKEI